MIIKEIDANAFKHFYNGWSLDRDYSLLRFNYLEWLEMADYVQVSRRGWELEPLGSYSIDYSKRPISKVTFPMATDVIRTVTRNAKTEVDYVKAKAIHCHLKLDWLIPHHRIGYLLDGHSELESNIYEAWNDLKPFSLKKSHCKKMHDAMVKNKDCPVLLWTELPRQMVVNAAELSAYYTYKQLEQLYERQRNKRDQ